MLKLLVVNSKGNSMLDLIAAFEQRSDVSVVIAQNGAQALDKISSQTFDLVVISEKPEDISGLELTKKIVTNNPMINCATASDLAPEDFHEASEGLGILMQLPSRPKKEQVTALLKRAQEINNMLNKDSNSLIQTSGKE